MADEVPDAESPKRRGGLDLAGREDEHLESKTADETGERAEREPPDQHCDSEGHLIRNGKSPSVR